MVSNQQQKITFLEKRGSTICCHKHFKKASPNINNHIEAEITGEYASLLEGRIETKKII